MVEVPSLRGLIPLQGAASWANYPLGVAWVLTQAGYLSEQLSFDLAVASDLPAGAGMSSSAAFELATAYALAASAGFSADPVTLARICRKAENDFAGMPCGLLDQGVSAYGAADQLVQIDCFSETFSHVPLPAGVHFHVFNTTKKHALVESAYATRARECREAFSIIQQHHPEVGCLAHAEPAWVQELAPQLGEVRRRRAEHITREHRRVLACGEALAASDLIEVGRLLVASHHSSRDLFENSCPELDFLVERLRTEPGVFGCRLSGGGFGGAVMAMTTADFTPAQAAAVAADYTTQFGAAPLVFPTQPGPGAHIA